MFETIDPKTIQIVLGESGGDLQKAIDSLLNITAISDLQKSQQPPHIRNPPKKNLVEEAAETDDEALARKIQERIMNQVKSGPSQPQFQAPVQQRVQTQSIQKPPAQKIHVQKANALDSDAELARMLQEQFDSEMRQEQQRDFQQPLSYPVASSNLAAQTPQQQQMIQNDFLSNLAQMMQPNVSTRPNVVQVRPNVLQSSFGSDERTKPTIEEIEDESSTNEIVVANPAPVHDQLVKSNVSQGGYAAESVHVSSPGFGAGNVPVSGGFGSNMGQNIAIPIPIMVKSKGMGVHEAVITLPFT
eukprot:TRINITY_DN795_c0_g1_i1.p1 TRINITY_DN795_c0_g1~~TRINITY_DN795_c0_g1_i1.p1  ORF type:complete len:301 (-),score=75.76 TRINITY_DN795_c0_g1_i1:165-1067(-)